MKYFTIEGMCSICQLNSTFDKMKIKLLLPALFTLSIYSQQIPSCFYRLGTGNKGKGITSGVHTSTFNIDEQALEIGVSCMVQIAMS